MSDQTPGTWRNVGMTTAPMCGHRIPIQAAINDQGEVVSRIDGYPDPNAEPFQYDAIQLCIFCYRDRMNRRPISFEQMRSTFSGR